MSDTTWIGSRARCGRCPRGGVVSERRRESSELEWVDYICETCGAVWSSAAKYKEPLPTWEVYRVGDSVGADRPLTLVEARAVVDDALRFPGTIGTSRREKIA